LQFRTIREFIRLESSAGIILFIAAICALVVDNSPLHNLYHDLFHLPFTLQLGALVLSKPLLLWVNDGFMSIFFLLVGLEIKRECLEGELNTLKKAMLPAIAAFGGMVVPALVYIYFNSHDPSAMAGWAIPTATDIAFSLGILVILGSRIPVSLKIFLTALAIFDDIGAIVIIAIFYTEHISMSLLLAASVLVLCLLLLNRWRVRHFAPYFLVGLVLWFCVLKSGVHATLAGIILAFMIPIRDKKTPGRSPLRELEHMLHPWVAFGILPLFAFANAGVTFQGMHWAQFIGGIPLGIAAGLFIGKQLGIWGASWLAVKMGLCRLPKGANALGLYGISMIAGVGFTMSLFIGSLAFGRFDTDTLAMVRVGVLVGSFLSGGLGYLVLRKAYPYKCVSSPKEL